MIDSLRDAHSHCKVVGYSGQAGLDLIEGSGIELDEGYIDLTADKTFGEFVGACRLRRLWERDSTVFRYPSFNPNEGIRV